MVSRLALPHAVVCCVCAALVRACACLRACALARLRLRAGNGSAALMLSPFTRTARPLSVHGYFFLGISPHELSNRMLAHYSRLHTCLALV